MFRFPKELNLFKHKLVTAKELAKKYQKRKIIYFIAFSFQSAKLLRLGESKVQLNFCNTCE